MARLRSLQLIAARHLAPLAEGAWRMTGSDPQFLVHGPFERGVWEWTCRAAVDTEAPAPAPQIYYAPNGQFSDAWSVRFPPMPRTPAEYILRFWLPYTAAVLRFDPADAPGVLTIGDVTARRDGRWTAAVRAVRREIRRDGARAIGRWAGTLARAAVHGPSSIRRALLDLIVHEHAATDAASIAAVVSARAARYAARPEPGLFALITTVYNTPPEYLRELADSVRAQSWEAFEWIVLDNGSADRGTLRALAAIAADPRVKLTRVDENLGILGGMRHVLERATARYVLPVDSDDYLFPDTLAVMAAVIQREQYPVLLYSDEDKLRDGRHVDPFVKPDWDPVLFRNCCYVAHLCAIRRDEALRLGVYTDAAAEGCHDWDTFLHLSRQGHVPVHVPEVLYSWRMHGGSTAANVAAKDYVLDSQRHVLERHLRETGLDSRFSVVRSPLFPASPDWWIRRSRASPAPVALVIHAHSASAGAVSRILDRRGDYPLVRVFGWGTRQDADVPIEWPGTSLVRTLQAAAAAAPLVVVADAGVVPSNDEWLWEMTGLKESFADAVLIGGRLVDSSGVIVSPDTGRRADDPGYFGTALKQRTTGVLDLRLAAIDSGWLRSIDLAPLDHAGIEQLASALAHAARDSKKRIVMSPFIEATSRT
jgi:Glycosyl transferase family 2